jgi:hypothetical protein
MDGENTLEKAYNVKITKYVQTCNAGGWTATETTVSHKHNINHNLVPWCNIPEITISVASDL